MIPEIDTEAFATAHADGAVVIDVREPFEYIDGHVAGAELIPMAELPAALPRMPRGETVYLICATGNRSYHAAGWLRRAGVDAVSVAGGTSTWRNTGRHVVCGPHPVDQQA